LLALTDEIRWELDKATQQGLMAVEPINIPLDPPGDCNRYV